MSEPVTPLAGASFNGDTRIQECPRRGMITLRGDLSAAALRATIKALTGAPVPGIGTIVEAGACQVAWMSPDEVMLMLPVQDVPAALDRIAGDLADMHHMAVDVSDARVVFELDAGTASREVLGKLAPIDFAPDAFAPGTFRRSRLAQVPAAIWGNQSGTFCVMCFRSVAEYAFGILSTAALPGGAVGHY